MRDLLAQVERVAAADTTVLLTGETGIGKELIARALRGLSKRGEQTLVKLDCAALPSQLIESEPIRTHARVVAALGLAPSTLRSTLKHLDSRLAQ